MNKFLVSTFCFITFISALHGIGNQKKVPLVLKEKIKSVSSVQKKNEEENNSDNSSNRVSKKVTTYLLYDFFLLGNNGN